ncbi:MAG TPA: transcription-repair coupling factor, partial [Humibacillus xanthopallidus]|nr:transcription-repair coupling factor [Humibacillus xanthopallidus]
MSHPLLSAFRALPDVHHVLQQVGRARLVDVSASDGTRPFLVAALAQQAQVGPEAAPVVVVTATTREAEDLASSLGAFLPSEAVAVFPSWETLPHERLSPRSDTVGRRLAVLRRVAHPDPGDAAYGPLSVVVAPVRAVLQPLTKGLGDLEPVALRPGDERPLTDVVDALVAAAYTRTDLVERRGEFAVRGGILDVFPPTEEHPVRIEFWGDTVEEVRWFKVADQRSLEIADHGLWAPPCRELLLTDDVRARARALADQLPGVSEMLSKVAEGIAVEGMESLAPALVDGMESVLDVLPQRSIMLVADPERVRRRAHDLVATSEEFLEASWANAAAGNHVPVDLQSLLGSASYWSLADVRALAQRSGRAWWTLTPFAADADLVIEDDDVDERLAVRTTDPDAFRGDTDRAVEHLRERVRDGWAVAVVTEGPGLAKRIAEVLGEHEVAVRQLDTSRDDSFEPGSVHVTTAPLGRGFVHEGARVEVLTETDL